jgi:hypothetical protein
MLAWPLVSSRRPAPISRLLLLLAVGAAALQAESAPPEATLVDRIVAAVDDDPILASDLARVMRLGLAGERFAGESDDAFARRVLDRLIEQRLRFHEVDRFGAGQVSVGEIEATAEEIRSRFPTEEAFRQSLAEVDLTETGLSQLIARQLAILAYVDERLGARVFVSLEEIRAHYEAELAPALAAEGQPVPPIEAVREQIRAVLRERRLNEEIERWTEELRRKADVIDLWEGGAADLPPVVATIRQPKPSPP